MKQVILFVLMVLVFTACKNKRTIEIESMMKE
jgi:hypothetical protein